MPSSKFLSASGERGSVLLFEGSNFLRMRVALSLITQRAISVSNVRARDEDPGFKEYEASLLRLVDKMTNGTRLQINETGTKLDFWPGQLIGGRVEHDCSLGRGLGYYLEFLMAVAPYCKHPVNATLKGATNCAQDASPELLRSSGLNILKT